MKKRTGLLLVFIAMMFTFVTSSFAEETSNNIRISNYGVDTITVQSGGGADNVTYVAMYQDGVLEQVNQSESGVDTVSLSLEDCNSYEYEIKAFCWDKETMKPAADAMDKKAVRFSMERLDIDESSKSDNSFYVYDEDGRNPVVYPLSADMEFYVNGVAQEYNIDMFNKFNHSHVTLIKDSGKSDYNVVLVSTYSTAVVDEVIPYGDGQKIIFKEMSSDISIMLMLENNSTSASYEIILDGNEITPEKLQENDVLSIAYDKECYFRDSDFYKIIVSRNTLEGRVNGLSPDGTRYAINEEWYIISHDMYPSLDISVKYKVYFDYFGEIVYAEEVDEEKNIAILENLYQSTNGEWKVRIFTQSGEDKEFVIDDDNAEEYSYMLYKSEGIKNSIEVRVIEYNIDVITNRLTIKNDNVMSNKIFIDREYNLESNKIGNINLSEKTYFINASDTDNPRPMKLSDLKDECEYTGYAYCESNVDSTYRFVIITNGIIPEYGIGIIEDLSENTATIYTNDGFTEFEVDNKSASLINSMLTESRTERIIKYTMENKLIIAVEKLTGQEYSGYIEDGMIDSYKLPEDGYINYLYSDRVECISQKSLLPEIEYTVIEVKDNEMSFAVITSGQIYEQLSCEIGVLNGVYKDNDVPFAQIFTSDGDLCEYSISSNDYDRYISLVNNGEQKKAVEERVVLYTVSNTGKLTIRENSTPVNLSGTYNETDKTIGDVTVSDSMTQFIYEDEYGDLNSYNKSSLKNGGVYEGCAFETLTLGYVRVVVVKSGLLQKFNIGVLEEVTDENTAYIYPNDDYMTYSSDVSGKLDEIKLKPIAERVVYYAVDTSNNIVSVEALRPVEKTGYFENDAIDDYKISNPVIYVGENNRIEMLNPKCLFGNEMYTLNTYSINNLSFAILTDGAIDKDKIYDIGILENIYKQANGAVIAQVITVDGKAEEYRVTGANVQKYGELVYDVFVSDSQNIIEYADKKPIDNRVIKYMVNADNEIGINKINGAYVCESGIAAVNEYYDEATSSIGQLKISDDTIILDVTESNDRKYTTITIDNLVNGGKYSMYGYNSIGNDSPCRFVIVTDDTASFNSTTQLAVFQNREIVDDNNYNRNAYSLVVNGKQQQVMLDDDIVGDADFADGDLILYATNSLGYISRVCNVFSSENMVEGKSKYSSFRDYAFANYESILNKNELKLNEQNRSAILSDNINDVNIVFGPVIDKYDKVFTIGTITKDGNDYLTDLYKNAVFVENTIDTKVYTYDYNANPTVSKVLLNEDIHITPITNHSHVNGNPQNNGIVLTHEDIVDDIVFAVARTIDDKVQEIYLIVSGY